MRHWRRDVMVRFVVPVLLLFALTARLAAQPHITDVEHVGNITIAFITSDSATSRSYLTLEEGLQTRRAVIHERNSQSLWIDNLSNEDLFVQSGDLIKGGQQDRMVAYDQILDPHDTTKDITVFCIERGRSTKRGDEPIETFSSSKHAAPLPHLRAMAQHELTAKLLVPRVGGLTAPDESQLRLLELVQLPQSPFGGQADPAQQAIWNDVDIVQSGLTRSLKDSVTKNASETSLELALEVAEANHRSQDILEEVEDLSLPDKAVGYLYAVGGRIYGGDVYSSKPLFRKMWPKLERTLVMHALQLDTAEGSISQDQFTEYLDQATHGKEASTHSNDRTEIHVWETPTSYLFEARDTQHPESAWLHRQYVTK